jgi:Domain of unknown function (DUF4160)
MPTVLPAFKGWRVVIYPNDHLPPHVHVIGAQEHARFELHRDLPQVRLLSNIRFSLSELRLVESYLLNHLAHLCSEWGRIHGNR